MSTLPNQFVHALPVLDGAREARGSGPRSLLHYDLVAERLGALVAERRTDAATARHAMALAFVLACRLPRHLEFGRRPATAIPLDPGSADVLGDLGLRADVATSALAALEATGVVWPDDIGLVTLAGDALVPLVTEAAERRSLPHLLDIGDVSARLDVVIPMTTRGSRERKSGAWFVLATIAAAAAHREWVGLAAGAFRAPLSFEASGVTKAIGSCVEARILERYQRPGETAQYRFIPVVPVVARSASPLLEPTHANSPAASVNEAPACVVEINGAILNLARGAELTVESGMRCRVTRDPETGAMRVVVE